MSSRREFPALGNPCLVACQIGENFVLASPGTFALSHSDILAIQDAITIVESAAIDSFGNAINARTKLQEDLAFGRGEELAIIKVALLSLLDRMETLIMENHEKTHTVNLMKM
jgi:hypothetical protein